jgi:hypothetical protein
MARLPSPLPRARLDDFVSAMQSALGGEANVTVTHHAALDQTRALVVIGERQLTLVGPADRFDKYRADDDDLEAAVLAFFRDKPNFVYPPSVPNKWRRLHQRSAWSPIEPIDAPAPVQLYRSHTPPKSLLFVKAPGGITPIAEVVRLDGVRVRGESEANGIIPDLAALALAAGWHDELPVEPLTHDPVVLRRQIGPGDLSGMFDVRNDRSGIEEVRKNMVVLHIARECRFRPHGAEDPRFWSIEWAVTGNINYDRNPHARGSVLLANSAAPMGAPRRQWDFCFLQAVDDSDWWRTMLNTQGIMLRG